MSKEAAWQFLQGKGLEDRIQYFQVSSATVELAAAALGVEPARIAKTISLYDGESAMLVLAAGDAKIDNHKFKAVFGFKPKMLAPDDVLRFTGHAIGGVCPFGVPEPLRVFLDRSLERFDIVYPAAGTDNSAVRLAPSELMGAAEADGWVDVCKGWE